VSRSIQRRLSGTLALAIVIVGLLAGIVSFGLAYIDAQDLQDDTLREIAALATLTPPGSMQGNASHADRQATSTNESETDILLVRLPGDPRPAWLPEPLSSGFQTVASGSQKIRVFTRDLGAGQRVVVAQDVDVREELALSSALRTLIPVLLLIPLQVWLAARIVSGEMAPVRRLSQSLDKQPPDRLERLPDTKVPDEIRSFVASINRLLDRMNRVLGEQRRFIADASHELRSPLTALSVQAENLVSADTMEEMRRRAVPLKAGIERARHMTEQLLSLARTQARVGEPRSVDLSKIARELIAENLAVAEARGIDLGLEESSHVVLFASRDLLWAVLSNAIDNAIRHTPLNGRVTVRLSREGDRGIIEVVDTGPGIPESERIRVFDPFYRTEGVVGEGSGLGLAIVRDAAEKLGGIVSLHTPSSGPGLVFRYQQTAVPIGS
jgi:two-component system, OmpR family, sensor kinase